VHILLEALTLPARFLPIDISGEHLHQVASALRAQHPTLEVHPVVADYTAGFILPPALGRRAGFYPGSSIGNFEPHDARELRAGMARWADGGLLVGVDLVKDPALLHDAYNDAQGITAAFNLNLLARANRELGADFDLDGFQHHALYQPVHLRIETHLFSRRAQTVTLFGKRFHFDEGQSLQTENSYKYTPRGARPWRAAQASCRARRGRPRRTASLCTGWCRWPASDPGDRHEGNLERHRGGPERRYRRRRGQPLLPRRVAAARVHTGQQHPHDVGVEGRGQVPHAVRRRRRQP
jgi:dimethylhistidine N-methyltransferase